MNQNTGRILGLGPLGLIGTLVVWTLAIYFQADLSLPRLPLSPGWRWTITLLFLIDGGATLLWGLVTLAAARRNQQLATTGPYAFIRHPMYAALLLSGTGAVAFAFESWLVLLGVIPLQLWWLWLVRFEEQALVRRWGDAYLTYAARTGQFLPHLATLKKAFSNPDHSDGADD